MSKPHRLDVVGLRLTAVEVAILGKLGEQTAERCLVGTCLAPLMIGASGCLGIADDDAVPSLRTLDAHHARAIDFLIGPERVADVRLLQHPHEVALPLHRVVAELTHIHRALNGVAEVDVVTDGLSGSRTSIAVAGVHQLIIVRGIVEHPEEAVPMGAAQQDDVVLVDLANGFHTALVERLQQGVERVLVAEVVSDRLVHQLVAQDDGLLLVAVGYLAPNLAEELLRRFALEEPGIAVPIIDVVARLSAWAVVHIEDEIEPVGTAPTDDAVDALVAILCACLAHIVLVGEELVVEGQADGVGTLLSNEVDVGTGHIVVLELLPELGCEVRTYGFLEEQVDHPR